MPEYKCHRCEKCLSTKQKLKEHLDKKKPCVNADIKTKFQCNRCLKYLSTKQALTSHLNKKIKCEIYRHHSIIKTDLEKEIDLNLLKDKMLTGMKDEYIEEVKKIYRKFDNSQILLKKKAILTKRYNDNIKRLHDRKIIPENMLSIKPSKMEENNSLETLFKAYKNIKDRLEKNEKVITSLEDEQEHTFVSIISILDGVNNDREKILNIRKELKKRMANYKEYVISK